MDRRETTTIQITTEMWRELNQRKQPGDTFDDVLWRLLEDDGGGNQAAADDGSEQADPEPRRDEVTHDEREPDGDDLEQRVREWLDDHPPKTDHGKRAVMAAWRELRAAGTMQTGALQDEVFPAVSDHYSSKRTMWNAIDRYLKEVPGIEKTGYGEWGYAGDQSTEADL